MDYFEVCKGIEWGQRCNVGFTKMILRLIFLSNSLYSQIYTQYYLLQNLTIPLAVLLAFVLTLIVGLFLDSSLAKWVIYVDLIWAPFWMLSLRQLTEESHFRDGRIQTTLVIASVFHLAGSLTSLDYVNCQQAEDGRWLMVSREWETRLPWLYPGILRPKNMFQFIMSYPSLFSAPLCCSIDKCLLQISPNIVLTVFTIFKTLQWNATGHRTCPTFHCLFSRL